MKISILCSIISGFGRKGFYQSQEIGLGRALAARGHEVVICKAIAREAACPGPVSEQIAEQLIFQTVPVRHIGVHGLLPAGVIETDSDAVFVFADTQLVVRGIFRYCRRHHIAFIPYVGIAHSFRAGFKARSMEFLYRHLTLPVYRRCTVVAKTEGARQELLRQGVPDCVVAPVGLDSADLHRDFETADRDSPRSATDESKRGRSRSSHAADRDSPRNAADSSAVQDSCGCEAGESADRRESRESGLKSRAALRRKWGFEPEDVIVSFIARLEPEKRPLDMIDLFARMENHRKKLLMVGKGPLLGEVLARARERGLQERVVILPEVPHDQMWELHTIADFFVSLRTDEIFGMALMEAVYYRSTVLARRAPGPEEILKVVSGVVSETGGKAHHLCDSDEEIVRWLNAGPSEEDALRAAQEQLVKRFTWDHCADVIESLAERSLAEREREA